MVFLWFSHGFPMVFPWFSYGFPMVFPWFSHGFTEEHVLPKTLAISSFHRKVSQRGGKIHFEAGSKWPLVCHLFFDFQGMGQVTYEFTHIAIENDPFIVDLPMKNGDFPDSYVCLPEGTYDFTWGNFDIQRSQLWLRVLSKIRFVSDPRWELGRFAQASLQSGEPLPSWLSFKHEFAAGRRNGKWLCPISRGCRMCQPLPTPVAGSMLIYIYNMYTLYDMCTLIKLCV